MKLKDKVALVTGASLGIGKATAIALAKEGCSVIVNYKSDAKSGEEVLRECNLYSKNNCLIQADVSKEEAILEMFEKIKTQYDHLDILINNAGIFNDEDSPVNIEVFESIYRNNFLSCVMVTKYALELLSEGKIVNMSSVNGKLGNGKPSSIAYSSFKAGLESYTKNIAKSLAPKILVNAIAPGRVLTPMWGNLNPEEQNKLGQVHLIQRMIQPEEIAESVIFLVKSDVICGEILTVDGGMNLVTLG